MNTSNEKIVWGIWLFILIGIVISASFQIIPRIGHYNSKRFLEIALLVLVIAYLGFSNIGDFFKIFDSLGFKIRYSIYTFFLIGLLSSLFAPHPYHSLKEVLLFTALTLFIFFNANLYHKNPALYLKIFLASITLLAGIYIVNFFISYASILVKGYGEIWPSQSVISEQEFLGFVYVRFFNQVQTVTFFLLLLPYFYFSDKYWAWKKFSLVLGCMWFVFIFASGARGTFYSIILSLIITFLFFRGRIYSWLKVIILLGLCGFLLNYFLFEIVTGDSLSRLSRTHSSGRLTMWLLSIEQLIIHPIIGIGPMQLADLNLNISHAHPHNGYLQILVEWGIPAFLLMSFVSFTGITNFIKLGFQIDRQCKSTDIYIALLLTIFAAAIHTFVSGVIVMPLSQLLLTIVLGFALGFWFKSKNRNADESNSILNKNLFLRRGVLALVMGGLILVLVFDYPNLKHQTNNYMNYTGDTNLRPRFWHQGKIVNGLYKMEKRRPDQDGQGFEN